MLEQILLNMFSGSYFAGGIGIVITFAILYTIKNLPHKLYIWFRTFFLFKIEMTSRDEYFFVLNKWLIRKSYPTSSRSYKIVGPNWNDYIASDLRCIPGFGISIVWIDWNPIFIKREFIQSPSSQSITTEEKISVASFSRTILNQIVRELTDVLYGDSKFIRVTYQGNSTCMCNEKPKRPLTTMISGYTENILDDLVSFLSKEQEYISKGINYKRNYLLYGTPGTGKTSTIYAVASYFGYNILMINLAGDSNVDRLLNTIEKLNNRTILVLEDIDAMFNKAIDNRDNHIDCKKGADLSTLLNILDGFLTKHGQLCFITTNHINKLDAAFIRSGRIDRKYEFTDVDVRTALKLVDKLKLDKDLNYIRSKLTNLENIVNPARVQEMSMYGSNEEIIEYFNKQEK